MTLPHIVIVTCVERVVLLKDSSIYKMTTRARTSYQFASLELLMNIFPFQIFVNHCLYHTILLVYRVNKLLCLRW